MALPVAVEACDAGTTGTASVVELMLSFALESTTDTCDGAVEESGEISLHAFQVAISLWA